MHHRGVRGRVVARLMLLTALALVSVLALLSIAAPNTMGGDQPFAPPPWWGGAVLGLGAVGIVVGLVWMIRIDRAARDPERHGSFWRSER